jgi:hypothetical protein
MTVATATAVKASSQGTNRKRDQETADVDPLYVPRALKNVKNALPAINLSVIVNTGCVRRNAGIFIQRNVLVIQKQAIV